MYKLTITKKEENPEYKEPDSMTYGYRMSEPIMEREIEVYKTTATLNEEQWKKVQKAIIEALN